MMNKPYVVTVMKKYQDGNGTWWDKKCYRYSTPQDMIYWAGYLEYAANAEYKHGKIIDFEISY